MSSQARFLRRIVDWVNQVLFFKLWFVVYETNLVARRLASCLNHTSHILLPDDFPLACIIRSHIVCTRNTPLQYRFRKIPCLFTFQCWVKPLAERRRRRRINDSVGRLKTLLMQATSRDVRTRVRVLSKLGKSVKDFSKWSADSMCLLSGTSERELSNSLSIRILQQWVFSTGPQYKGLLSILL